MPPEPPANNGRVPVGRRRDGWRLGITLTALIIGLAGLVASATGIAGQVLPRRFTAPQAQKIVAWETGKRWRAMPAGKIFPDSVTYQLPAYDLTAGNPLPLVAERVGIAPQTTCAAGTDPATARVLSARGCTVMLRATYADETDSLLVTIGVAVMPGAAAANSAAARLSDTRRQPTGVRTAAFPDTLASAFGDQQRQLSMVVSKGPYVFLSAVGYADGRPQVPVSSDPYADEEMTSFADGVSDVIEGVLGSSPSPPRCPGAPGC
jgi:hypothetical protein